MTPTDTAILAQSILDTHHAFLHRELPRLGALLVDASPRLKAPFQHLQRVMDEHMRKEEGILFPMILALADGGAAGGCGVAGPIAQMGAEHDEIRTLEEALRAASRDAGELEPALLALLDDLSVHAAKEDELLFPAALALARGDHAPAEESDEPPAARGPRRKASPVPSGPPKTRVVRETQGTCSTCLERVPAAVLVREGTVLLEKRCPVHGPTEQLLSRRPERWVELDRFYFSVMDESHPQRDFIVRMTERCNLACPICLAKANTEDTPDLDLSGLETLLSERRGVKIDLMAAEPTLREDLEDWVRRVKASGNIAALHTNGIKLADRAYAERLRDAGVDEVFLQFDGLDEEANKVLRGRPLLKARKAALRNLHDLGIATSLIVVIARGLNESQVGETFRFALEPGNEHIREVFFLGLRNLGSARESGALAGQQLMPDEIIELLTAQEPAIRPDDVHQFNLAYFAMLSAFKVKKCLYVQHYLVARDGQGGFKPISEIVDLPGLAKAAVRYSVRRKQHPTLARAGFGASIVKAGLRPGALRMASDLVRLESLFASGMNLREVPPRFLLIGFITACDPDNFDAQVAVNCGKGELSADGGFIDSGAVANVLREARFAKEGRAPGTPWRAQPPPAD
jgi:molybdenum cofactor biosynthesis enzyme MoaA/iron-sulfur cluster repair protein YtfE (RIC family)